MEESTTGLSVEFHPVTFVVWPALVLSRSIGVCEDCQGAEPIDPQAFGWCITLSFLVWSLNFTWEDRA